MHNNVTHIGLPDLTGLTTGQRAIRAARMCCETAITAELAAAWFRVHTRTIVDAQFLIDHGTAQEIASVEEGKKAPVALARALRRRVKANTAEPNPAAPEPVLPPRRKRRVIVNYASDARVHSQVWAQLKGALTELATMPSARDVALIARDKDRKHFVADHLDKAMKWLGEFADEWTRPD